MSDLKSLPTQQIASYKEQFYLSKESSTVEEKIIINKGTASSVAHTWMSQEEEVAPKYRPLYSGHQPYPYPGLRSQVGADFKETVFGLSYSIPHISFGREVLSQYQGFTASDVLSIKRPRPISSDEIIIVPLRELPRDYAKREIAEYIQRAGGRKVYISELAEELRFDIELIMEVMEELETGD